MNLPPARQRAALRQLLLASVLYLSVLTQVEDFLSLNFLSSGSVL